MTLTLYTDALRISPFVLTAWVALKEKQLDFTLRDVDLERAEQRRPELLAPSLTGKVPVLVHDDFWLTESVAIAEYLAESFPFPAHPRLFPPDFKDRARCRQVMLWLRTEPQLSALRKERSTHTLFFARDRAAIAPLSAEAEQARAELVRFAEAVLLPGREHLCDAWCIADVDLALTLNRLLHNGDGLPPRLAAYVERQWQRPSVQSFVALPRPER